VKSEPGRENISQEKEQRRGDRERGKLTVGNK
jgi:hypothetical protein